jgi:hypothetical protein
VAWCTIDRFEREASGQAALQLGQDGGVRRVGHSAEARAEKAALAEIAEEASRPLRLPSNDEVMALATDLEGCLTDDPEVGRATLRRWLSNGVIRVDQSPQGPIAETELLPLMVLVDRAEKGARNSGRGGGGARQVPENSKSLEMVASPGISSC